LLEEDVTVQASSIVERLPNLDVFPGLKLFGSEQIWLWCPWSLISR